MGASATERSSGTVMGYVGVKSCLLIALKLASGEQWDRSEMKQVCAKVTLQ